jgi:Mg2+ and Co2+ transporter CorA
VKKDTYYFSHDANARKDEKILCLLAEHGYEGYGIYWVLVEMMFENQDTAISRKLIKGIAYDLRVDITLLQKVITTCYNVKLFDADKEKIWSNSLRRRKAEYEEKKKRRSNAGKLGMAARWHNDNNVTENNNNVIAMPNAVITNHNKGKESKVKKRNRERVVPEVDFYEKQFADHSGDEFIDNYKKVISRLQGNNDEDLIYKNVLSMPQQLTYKQYLKLRQKGLETGEDVFDILKGMENRSDVCRSNESVYLTANNWINIRNKRAS